MSDLAILETSIVESMDPAFVKKTLSELPFYQIQGMLNVRAIPLPPTSAKRGLILRSAETNHITSLGKTQISQELGVTKIFDLRGDKERARFGPDPLDIPDVEIVCVPAMSASSQTDDLKATFTKFAARGDECFVDFYREVLDNGVSAYKTIFEFLRDEVADGKGCLIHCSGGKDRTGVAAMLILDLIGVPDEEIVKDYALTRVGVEPVREMMMTTRFAPLLLEPEVREATVSGMSCKPSAMRATLKMLREEYGGAAGYLKDRLGFSAEGVAKIIENLSSKEA
ncbi:hypothetical protein M407DRAFT_153800 [Tulasnella calospora MUT 4182]|uniref:Tyrosine specific protein phosphatases domain-containing protein n=1 Tax=Tulasnella calospora MUT 4182 TaxID=1051891 RepID=A0A0C3QFY1_9AGAM|nr:hypothetical protein M407DRAFT_153800 [Tulasnella calospora MUT 4182]